MNGSRRSAHFDWELNRKPKHNPTGSIVNVLLIVAIIIFIVRFFL